MEIREIREQDIPPVLELTAGTMVSSTQEYIDEYGRELDEYMRHYLAYPDKSAQYVALDNDRIIGFVLAGIALEKDLGKYYFVDYTNPREILSWVLLLQITVQADYRGRDVGSVLIERVAQRAEEMAVKGVYTGTRSTIRFFYEKNGFEVDKVFLKRRVAPGVRSPHESYDVEKH